MTETRERTEQRAQAAEEAAADVTGAGRAGDAFRELTRISHVARLCMLGELSAALAHELNQPLAAILATVEGWAQEIRSDRFDADEFLRDTELLADETKRAASLVARVRGFARREPPHHSTFCVNEVIRDVAQLLAPVVRPPAVMLDLRLEEPIPALVGDRVLVHQVILNLLLNAIEAAVQSPPEAREVSVITRAADDRVKVVIEDSGPPISPSALEQAFVPFHTTKDSGIGLGLALARRIVEDHDGVITLDARPGGGVAARVVLPVSGDQS